MPRPPTLDLQAIKFAVLALGVLALLAGVALFLIQNDLTIAVRVALALGIVLIGGYVAIDPEDVLRRLSGRGALYSGNTLVLAVAGLGILGLLNVLAGRPPVHQRLDLTANKQFSLSEQSIQLARQLPAPVKATGFFVNVDRSQQDNAETLLKQYQTSSGGKLSYEFVDPEQRPAQAQALGVRQSGTVVFQMGDQRQNATNPDEQSFTQALLKLENPTAPKVYFTTGHGERDTNAVDEAGYNSALQLLQKQNFQVDNLNLLTSSKVPDDAAVLVIAAPTKPFADAEKQAVQDYLGKGGALLLLIDLQTDHQVADYVAPWKVQVQWQPIIDPASSLPGDPLTPVVDTYINHAITKNLDRKFTVWPSTAALVFPKDPPAEGDFVAPLAESSARSWMESDFDAEVKAGRLTFDQGKDTVGPITIAGVIEANAAQQPPKDPQHPEQQPKKTRVVVVADADFLSNQLLRLQTFNPDFLLNTMNWLGASEQLISIPPKDPANNTIVLTGTQANTITLTTVVILPLLVLAAGAFVWWSRR